MFDVLSVPRASNSSYLGIPTQKTHAIEYHTVSNKKHDITMGFQENTNKLIPLSGKLDIPLTGVWQLVARDLTEAETYRVTVVVRDNELLEVLDSKGLIWRAEVAIPKKLHEEALHTSGCFEKVQAMRERAKESTRDAFWS